MYFKFNLDNFGIKESASVKYLGLTFNYDITWSTHISDLCGKLGRVNFALQTLSIIKFESLLTAYHRRFSSLMSYGIEVWGGSVHSSKVFIEEKRAIHQQ